VTPALRVPSGSQSATFPELTRVRRVSLGARPVHQELPLSGGVPARVGAKQPTPNGGRGPTQSRFVRLGANVMGGGRCPQIRARPIRCARSRRSIVGEVESREQNSSAELPWPTAAAWLVYRHSDDLATTVHGGPVHDTSAVAAPARTSVDLSGWPPRCVLAKICVTVGLGPAGQNL